MKLLNLFLNALYPEGVACLLCNRNARLDRCGLCEECRESIEPAAEIHIDGVISGAVAAMAYNDAAAQALQRLYSNFPADRSLPPGLGPCTSCCHT